MGVHLLERVCTTVGVVETLNAVHGRLRQALLDALLGDHSLSVLYHCGQIVPTGIHELVVLEPGV